jgi:hypothetical protein
MSFACGLCKKTCTLQGALNTRLDLLSPKKERVGEREMEKRWYNQPRYAYRPKQDSSCLVFWSAPDPTLTTHRTPTHTRSDLSTKMIYSYADQHIGSQIQILVPYIGLNKPGTISCLIYSAHHHGSNSDFRCGLWGQISVCSLSPLNRGLTKCLNGLLSLSTSENPKPRGPQFQQHSETHDSDQ